MKNNYKAVITTSANPFHNGHLYIYKIAEQIFGVGNVLCLIAKNSQKESDLQKIAYHMIPYNINFQIIENIAVADFCKKNNIDFIVRGIRNGVDAEYELKIDYINKKINYKLQTIYVPTTDMFSNISSSVIRELIVMKKFDLIQEFMNSESFHRYMQGKPKYIVYFGKSCVGKSTFLKTVPHKVINVDNYIWDVAKELDTIENVEKKKNILKKFIKANKTDAFHKYLECELKGNKDFWNKFFSKLNEFQDENEQIFLDFAAIGSYWNYIDGYYKSQIKLIYLQTDNIKRIQNIINRAGERGITVNEMNEQIKVLDSLYLEPPFYDEIINIDI